MPRLLDCYRSIAPIFGISSEVTKFGPNDDAKIARAGILISTPHRDAWYAAAVSYTKGVTVAVVGITSTW